MTRFPQLHTYAAANGCDKGLVGPTRNWGGNAYVDIYQAYLGPIAKDIRQLCEVGLGVRGDNFEARIAHGANREGGASVKMWSEFLPNAHIHGLDINSAQYLNNDRITTYQVDQSRADSLIDFQVKTKGLLFDVIIDDGSHVADHQQLTLSILWQQLRPGGYYFIEDLNDKKTGRHGTINAQTTRSLFADYVKTGNISMRHAFADTSFLSEVSYVGQHAFPPIIRLSNIPYETVRAVFGRSQKWMQRLEFNPNAPKLIALRKAIF